MFKSKVLEIYDLKNVNVPEELLRIEVDKSKLKDALMRVAKKKSVTIEVNDAIISGDQIIAEMRSSVDKFNKNIPIVIGMGLFNKSFEDKLLGLKKNEVKCISVDGSTVEVKITDIKRKTVPDVTNDMIMKLGIEGVSTVDEFNRYSFDEAASKIKEEKLSKIYSIALNEMAEKSKFELVQQDMEKLIDTELSRCRALAKSENMVLEEMTEEQLSARIPCRTVAKFKEFLKEFEKKQLKSLLIAMKFAKEEGIIFNESNYNEFIEKETASNNSDSETEKSIHPFLNYIAGRYASYLYEKVTKYFEAKFNYD